MRSIILFLLVFFSVINGQSFFSESPTKLIPGHFIFSSNSFIQDAYDELAPPELDFSEDYDLDEYRKFAERRGQRVGTMNIYVADHLLVGRLNSSGSTSFTGSNYINDFPSWLTDDQYLNNAFTSVVIKVKPLQSLLVMNSTETYSFIGAYKDLIAREPENSAILGLNTTNDSSVKTVEFKQESGNVLEVKSDGKVGIGNYNLLGENSPGLYVSGDVEFTGQLFGDLADTIQVGNTSERNFPIDSNPVTFTFSAISVPANSIAFVSAQVKIVANLDSNNPRYDVETKIEMYDSSNHLNKSISYIDSDSEYSRYLSFSPFLILENSDANDVQKTVIIEVTPLRNASVDASGGITGTANNQYKLTVSQLTGVSYKASLADN
jgi:hypothetical protein